MKRHHHSSIFKRLTMIYSITILSIYLIMVTLFLNNIFKSSHDFVLSKEIQSQTYVNNLESQLNTIYKQQSNLIEDTIITKLSYGLYKDNFEKRELILNLLKTINKFGTSSLLIEDVIVTIPSQDLRISINKGYEKASYDRHNTFINDKHFPIMETNGKISLYSCFPLTNSIHEDYIPDYIIQVTLSKEVLLSSLIGFNDYKGSDAALIISTDDPFIICRDGEEIVTNWFQNRGLEEQSINEKVRINNTSYQFLSTTSLRYNFTLLSYNNNSLINHTIIQYIMTLTLLTIVISFLFILVIFTANKMINKPLKEMVNAFEQLQEGNFDVQIYHKPQDEFQYIYHAFNYTVKYIQDLIKSIYKQKTLLQNAELEQLQSQINPHFLYNSFFIITRMAKSESYEQISQFVTLLAKYYRFINKETKDFIELIKEVEHMNNYIDIQQMRFGDFISICIQPMPENMGKVYVPRLILQPIVENAYNYGLENRLNEGILKITYQYEEPFIDIIIEDNGEEVSDELIEILMRKFEDDHLEKNNALSNVNKRLKLVYGELCGLNILRSELGGLKVIVRIKEEVTIKELTRPA